MSKLEISVALAIQKHDDDVSFPKELHSPKTVKKTFHSLEVSHEVSIKHCFSRNNKTLKTAILLVLSY